MNVRTAVIERRGSTTPEQVKAYLYANYDVLTSTSDKIYIQGIDRAGFTLDAIKDRLASGLIFATEITV